MKAVCLVPDVPSGTEGDDLREGHDLREDGKLRSPRALWVTYRTSLEDSDQQNCIF